MEGQEVREWTDMHTCKAFISQYTSSFHGVHEMALHSFKRHVACDGTVSNCMNFNMRRPGVILFTGFAVRETHATWLCDHLCMRCVVYVESNISF